MRTEDPVSAKAIRSALDQRHGLIAGEEEEDDDGDGTGGMDFENEAYTALAEEGKDRAPVDGALLHDEAGRESFRDDDDGVGDGATKNGMASPLALSVHLFAFNRPHKFAKLWSSLASAQVSTLPSHIVIHIDYDAKGSPEWRLQVAEAKKLVGSSTRHGPVSVLFAAKPKGLRVTMLEAWAPRNNEYAMFLEDDIEVSPLLFIFAERFVRAYGDRGRRGDPTILGFKLYNQKWDEVNQRAERAVDNGHAPYKIQEPCSWGTVFAPQVYGEYLAWYVHNSGIDPFIPRAWSNTWDPERSAKKYLQRFMWEKGRFLVAINLPDYLSLTTPRVDSEGTNIKAEWLDYLRQRLEVPLLTSGGILKKGEHEFLR